MTDNKQPKKTGHDSFDEMRQRVTELEKTGLDHGHAWGISILEDRIKNWPSGWGDDLQVLIYGDFERSEKSGEIGQNWAFKVWVPQL